MEMQEDSRLGTMSRKRDRDDGDTTSKRAAPCTTSTRNRKVVLEELPEEQLELSIQVKWISATGRSKVSELPLRCVREGSQGVPKLSGIHRRLWTRAFPTPEDGSTPTPSSHGMIGTQDTYARFGTSEEVLNFPMDVVTTQYKLMAMGPDGWQYCLHETGPTSARQQSDSAAPKLHVTSIEFESIARVIGHLGIRMQMVAYPVVSVHREWLWATVKRMQTDPQFRGILS